MWHSTPCRLSAGAFAFLMASSAVATPVLPDFSTAVFDPAQPIDNPYFPMTYTSAYVYEDGPVDESLRAHQPRAGVAGVQTFIQRDREFEDGLLVEETLDYFAQGTLGNVWYLGEDVMNFVYHDDGTLVATEIRAVPEPATAGLLLLGLGLAGGWLGFGRLRHADDRHRVSSLRAAHHLGHDAERGRRALPGRGHVLDPRLQH